MTLTADMFNFENLTEKTGDPFAQQKTKYAKDERFYTLKKNDQGQGVAIIRFLPDAEMNTIQHMFTVNANRGKAWKRFVNEFSPQTIGLPDPFQERWAELYNLGDEKSREEAKVYGRGSTNIVNIKVITDPACPENEGKIFLYRMSDTLKSKIEKAMKPSEQDIALGAKPKQMFNPLAGHNFKLACSIGSNKITTYDDSEVISDVSSIYESPEQALEDIKNSTYLLSEFLKPESFLSYEELSKKLDWFDKKDSSATPSVNTLSQSAGVATQQVQTQPVAQTAQVQTTQTVQEPVTQSQPVQTTQAQSTSSPSIDDLLNSI